MAANIQSSSDLARTVAADFGDDVVAAVSAPQPAQSETRSFGFGEAVALGGLILSAAQLIVDIWKARQDREALVREIAEDADLMEKYPQIDPEQRLGVFARLLARFLPQDFGKPSKIKFQDDKRAWIANYLKSRGESPDDSVSTRDFSGGPPLLIPFADQNYWIVAKPIGWIPDESDGPGVVRVDVPRGFVTDLASVPPFLWPLFNKIGRHGNPAILHDWLYCIQPDGVSREMADRVFDRAMHDMGVDHASRKIMWGAVHIFGARYWDAYRAAKSKGARYVIKEFPTNSRVTWDEWQQIDNIFADD